MAKLLIPACLLVTVSCGSARHDIVHVVPLGSSLSELDRYLEGERDAGSYGEVIQWVPASPRHINDDGTIHNEFGTFFRRKLGSYDGWKASPGERGRFTGEIEFFHHGSTSDDVNAFVYVKGKLRKKEWGFLPG